MRKIILLGGIQRPIALADVFWSCHFGRHHFAFSLGSDAVERRGRVCAFILCFIPTWYMKFNMRPKCGYCCVYGWLRKIRPLRRKHYTRQCTSPAEQTNIFTAVAMYLSYCPTQIKNNRACAVYQQPGKGPTWQKIFLQWWSNYPKNLRRSNFEMCLQVLP